MVAHQSCGGRPLAAGGWRGKRLAGLWRLAQPSTRVAQRTVAPRRGAAWLRTRLAGWRLAAARANIGWLAVAAGCVRLRGGTVSEARLRLSAAGGAAAGAGALVAGVMRHVSWRLAAAATAGCGWLPRAVSAAAAAGWRRLLLKLAAAYVAAARRSVAAGAVAIDNGAAASSSERNSIVSRGSGYRWLRAAHHCAAKTSLKAYGAAYGGWLALRIMRLHQYRRRWRRRALLAAGAVAARQRLLPRCGGGAARLQRRSRTA